MTTLKALFVIGFVILASWAQAGTVSKDVIVITDMEPDDRLALILLMAGVKNRVNIIGTSVMDSRGKVGEVKKLLGQMGINNIPVYAGRGGHADSYPDIASSKAAREFEGNQSKGAAETGSDFRRMLRKTLRFALKRHKKMEVVLIAPPTDLIAVLEQKPELSEAIGHIHVMGGWSEVDSTQGWSTYNWNMDPVNSAKLMQVTNIPIVLYSSHVIKKVFLNGSVNVKNFSEIVDRVQGSRSKAVMNFRNAALKWDLNIIEKIPALKTVIGDQTGKQFTPADPLVVLGFMDPVLVAATVRARVTLEPTVADPKRGFAVSVVEDSASNIEIVTGINTQVFRDDVLRLLP